MVTGADLGRPGPAGSPLCQNNGISQIVWSPLAQGVLTGKYRPGEAPPADSRAAHSEMGEFIGMWTAKATLQAVQKLRPIAEGADLTMPQLALAWVLQHREVAAAIVGASRPDQVHGNAAASGVRLDQDVVDAVNTTLAAVAITGYRQSDE
jgi:1-deoxyxylulose-5-phosphate synthase